MDYIGMYARAARSYQSTTGEEYPNMDLLPFRRLVCSPVNVHLINMLISEHFAVRVDKDKTRVTTMECYDKQFNDRTAKAWTAKKVKEWNKAFTPYVKLSEARFLDIFSKLDPQLICTRYIYCFCVETILWRCAANLTRDREDSLGFSNAGMGEADASYNEAAFSESTEAMINLMIEAQISVLQGDLSRNDMVYSLKRIKYDFKY